MNPADAETLAHELMAEFLPDGGWTFRFDTARRRFGCCKRSRDGSVQEISLSRPLTTKNSRAEVENTIRHEIAHALAPLHAGHGPAWREACAITGARPVPCYGSEVTTAMPWQFTCEGCGATSTRTRRYPPTAYHCRNYALRWERTAA